MKRKIGIFGGTFNPPHIGHVSAAEAFITGMKLDELMIIPDYIPPHKEYSGNVTPEQRLEMAKIAFGHIERTTISDIEISRGGKSYTADTLSMLASSDTELYFLCGTDMFLTMEQWRSPEIIFSLAKICCIRREYDQDTERILCECADRYKTQYNADVFFVDSEVVEISSSELREELKIKGYSECISAPVMRYISEKGLYV